MWPTLSYYTAFYLKYSKMKSSKAASQQPIPGQDSGAFQNKKQYVGHHIATFE
jgi:hypothetical protein